MATVDVKASREAAGLPVGYDGLAMSLHWITALLVVTLFALAETWGFLPRGTPLRHGMQSIHISLGLMLAAVFLVRLVWRNTGARRVAPVVGGLQHVAALAVHYGLYGLLAVQIVLGFLFRWAEGPIGFFGLFGIPSPLVIGKTAHHEIAYLHDKVAWIIIILAGGHAAIALAHRYILHDHVLQRMLPRWSAR
ncbi:cytochrome b [Acidisoma sp.]|uniref:cytochrome b n=1 Tax=Acidisoma sp. TaxID=1872115 RepID=UPI003B0001E0